MTAVLNLEQTEASLRAALYFRVSTGRQAESDLSITDQRRQALAYCAARGWDVAIEFVEPGMSGTDDRRPELQRLLDMATSGGAPFEVVLVHSFSRFARDHFALEMHVRRLRKAGVRLVSITQDLSEDPMSVAPRITDEIDREIRRDDALKRPGRRHAVPPRLHPFGHRPGRSGRRGNPHLGPQKRPRTARRRQRRQWAGRSAQFCSEVARPKRSNS
jgi:hypothetical protein